MEADAEGEAEGADLGLAGSGGNTHTDGRAERSRPAGAGRLAGRGARERTHRRRRGRLRSHPDLRSQAGQEIAKDGIASYARPPVQPARIRETARAADPARQVCLGLSRSVMASAWSGLRVGLAGSGPGGSQCPAWLGNPGSGSGVTRA